MIITKTSPFTNKVNTMDIDVTESQLHEFQHGSGLIQVIMPNLTDSEREFIMTGITDDEWDEFVPDEDDVEFGEQLECELDDGDHLHSEPPF